MSQSHNTEKKPKKTRADKPAPDSTEPLDNVISIPETPVSSLGEWPKAEGGTEPAFNSYPEPPHDVIMQLHHVGKAAYSNFETIINSYSVAKHCIENNISGAFIECGVGAGSQIGAMGLACKNLGDDKRKIWAFDSYQGIPMASFKDDQQPGIGYLPDGRPEEENKDSLLISSGITVHSLDNVKGNLRKWNVNLQQYIFVKGWFQKTLPEVADQIKDIAILRLDGDLYESTRVCLEALYPKLVKGGILIIDDWALAGCRLACDEYFKDYKQLSERRHIKDTTPVWFVKK